MGEICAGDGALSEALVSKLPNVTEYIGLDRNERLVETANERFSKDATTRHLVLDIESPEGIHFIESAGPFDMWIASGSVLCNQVGSSDMAPLVLSAMASSLTTGGIMIITGYTQSRLQPKLIASCGLEILGGSTVPSLEAGGLESGFSRFHLFVLRKSENRDAPDRAVANKESTLRTLMLS